MGKAFKNGPSKFCRRQPLKNLKGYGLLWGNHIPSYFFKAVFHKFCLIYSWIFCFKWQNRNFTLFTSWFCIKLAKVNFFMNWKNSVENWIRVWRKWRFSFCTEQRIATGNLFEPWGCKVSLFGWLRISKRS